MFCARAVPPESHSIYPINPILQLSAPISPSTITLLSAAATRSASASAKTAAEIRAAD